MSENGLHWKNLSLDPIKIWVDGVGEVAEEWRAVVGYEGLYDISTMGRVKSVSRAKAAGRGGKGTYLSKEAIKGQFLSRKYCRVELSKNGVNRKHLVHTLVCKAFQENPLNKPQVNHLWGIKTDNRITELEWATKSEDRQHAIRVLGAKTGSPWKGVAKELHPMYGRRGPLAPGYGKTGDQHPAFGKTGALCKNSRAIICIQTGVEYGSIAEAARLIKISQSRISCVLNGTATTTAGYSFKYKEGEFVQKEIKRKTIKKIICVSNNKVYNSLSDASRDLDISASKICLVLKGVRSHTKGYSFKYFEL
jgi:hypothetical protein